MPLKFHIEVCKCLDTVQQLIRLSLPTLAGCIVIALQQFTSHQAQFELTIETANLKLRITKK